MPCPTGVNIPQNFAILNNYSFAEGRRRRWQARRGYKKLVDSVDKINEENPNGNASLCVDCGQCLEKCPQNINIPVELEKTHAILGKREDISQHFD
jgi:predicted aldo/keto reductase-like oxidoreductase